MTINRRNVVNARHRPPPPRRCCRAPRARAQAKDVKVALIAPLSGPWARQGELMKKGGDLAIKHINAGGGIKSLGGAKMQLVVIDAGDSAEKAKNAAQRMVSQEPDLIGGTGAWLSSFTLAVTEVTERASLPMLTLSYSDQITDRGFKYVFQTSPTAGAQSTAALPTLLDLAQKATGKRPTTAGHRHGQHRLAGQLRQADARGRLWRRPASSCWSTRSSRRRSPTPRRSCRRCARRGPRSCC